MKNTILPSCRSYTASTRLKSSGRLYHRRLMSAGYPAYSPLVPNRHVYLPLKKNVSFRMIDTASNDVLQKSGLPSAITTGTRSSFRRGGGVLSSFLRGGVSSSLLRGGGGGVSSSLLRGGGGGGLRVVVVVVVVSTAVDLVLVLGVVVVVVSVVQVSESSGLCVEVGLYPVGMLAHILSFFGPV